MFKKSIIILSIVLIVGWIAFFVVQAEKSNLEHRIAEPPRSNHLVLFYGLECPHCARVEDYLLSHPLKSSIVLEKKEVYHNKENQMLLVKTAKTCGLRTDKIGVPFLWDGNQCIVGDAAVMAYFQNRI